MDLLIVDDSRTRGFTAKVEKGIDQDDFFALVPSGADSFDVVALSHWYNVRPDKNYVPLSLEEVEVELKRRKISQAMVAVGDTLQARSLGLQRNKYRISQEETNSALADNIREARIAKRKEETAIDFEDDFDDDEDVFKNDEEDFEPVPAELQGSDDEVDLTRVLTKSGEMLHKLMKKEAALMRDVEDVPSSSEEDDEEDELDDDGNLIIKKKPGEPGAKRKRQEEIAEQNALKRLKPTEMSDAARIGPLNPEDIRHVVKQKLLLHGQMDMKDVFKLFPDCLKDHAARQQLIALLSHFLIRTVIGGKETVTLRPGI